MDPIQRKINIPVDRQLLLELHCEVNYSCDSHWARVVPYPDYRQKWLSTSQPEQFLKHMSESLADPRTIAEFVLDPATDEIAGYVWVIFADIPEYSLVVAELVDLLVVQRYRRAGAARALLQQIEARAIQAGANLLRSETGFANEASKDMHMKAGFEPYRILYENGWDRGEADAAASPENEHIR